MIKLCKYFNLPDDDISECYKNKLKNSIKRINKIKKFFEYHNLDNSKEYIYTGNKSYWMKLKIKILKKLSKSLIKNLYSFRKLCIDNNCLDESWFLDYQDQLNKLSIDPDRK